MVFESVKTFQYTRVRTSNSHFRKYWFEALLGTILCMCALYSVVSGSYFVNGGFSFNSLIHYGACFALASFFLNRQGVKLLDRMIYSLAIMASGIVLYEIVYHYGFGISFSILAQNASFFGLDSSNGAFPLDWFLIIAVIPFAWRSYMNLANWSLLTLIALEAIVMFVWTSIGYPQPQYPFWWPAYNPLFNVIPVTNGIPDYGLVLYYGQIFSEMAKTICLIPALFFNKK